MAYLSCAKDNEYPLLLIFNLLLSPFGRSRDPFIYSHPIFEYIIYQTKPITWCLSLALNSLFLPRFLCHIKGEGAPHQISAQVPLI